MAGKPIDNLSIIVSANTNPLAQDLQRAAREVDAFGKKVSRAQRDAERYASQVPRGAVAGATRGINALMINRGVTRDMVRDGTLRDLTQFGRPTFAGRAGGAIWGGAGAAAAFGGRLAGGGVTRVASAASGAAGSMLDFAKAIPPIAAGVAAAEVGLNGLAAGFQKVRESVQMAGELEQTRLAFEVMLGSAERANRLMADMRRFAASTPFALNEITGATRMLTAYGVAADQLMPTVRMLGDVSAAFGRELPIRDLTYLYGTLFAQQRAYAIDIRQFAGRGIPIYEELAKVLGKTNAEVKQLIEDGRVSSREVTQAFVNMTSAGGRFYGLTERQGKTFLGQWEQMADAFRLAEALFGQALIEELGLAEATRDLGAFARRLEGVTAEARPAIRFVGELTRAGVQLGYEFARAGALVGSVNLTVFERTFPGLTRAAEAFHQLVRDAKDFKIDEDALIDFAAGTADVVVRTFTSIADVIALAYRRAEAAAAPVLRTFERLDRFIQWADGEGGQNRPPSGATPRTDGPRMAPGFADRLAPLAGRREGDPIDPWALAPAVPGMSPDRVRAEYAALSRLVTHYQTRADELERLVTFGGRPDLVGQAVDARQWAGYAHRARGEYVLRSFPGDPADLTRQLDAGNVPPLFGSPGTRWAGDATGMAGAIGPAAMFPPRERSFGEQARAVIRDLQDSMKGEARRRREAVEQERQATELRAAGDALAVFRREAVFSGFALHDLGVVAGRESAIQTAEAGALGAAFVAGDRGRTRGLPPGGVRLPDVFPHLDELARDLRKEYDPRIDLQYYRDDLNTLRERRMLGDQTGPVTDLAWKKKVEEVAARLGIGQPIQLPSAVEAGSADDARLINAWRSQQASTTDQLLYQIEVHVRRLLGLAEALPQAPPPRPVRLPGD